ncbi:unnamed protein product [Paramecium sonneborni]|uniref:Uncharacterized protein n=1 Tax=Paramecium sonneborni TaxID=65129 RepID=A0A8S1M002_9CILI|nr:unnamed protein product [Paramecium sonneborni]
MNHRHKTELSDRHLNYDINYDSIIIENDQEQKNKNPQALLSLEFYGKSNPNQSTKLFNNFKHAQRINHQSLKKTQAIQSPTFNQKIQSPTFNSKQNQTIPQSPTSFLIKSYNLKLNSHTTSKPSLHTPSTRTQGSQLESQTPFDIKTQITKIKLILSSNNPKKYQLDFSKFKKSIY